MTFLIKRLVMAVPALLVLSFTVFMLLELSPGDAAEIIAAQQEAQGVNAGAAIEAVREELGTDRPFLMRYVDYLTMLLRGDMGWSVRTQRPVIEEIGQRLPNTLILAGGALTVTIVLGLSLGISSAIYHNRWWDQFVTGLVSLNQALPNFWVALVLVWIFAVQLGWLPVYGTGSWQHWVLPVVTLGLGLSSGLTRIVRVSIIEGRSAPHIKVAHAKGVPSQQVFRRHLLRVVAIPITAYIGLQAVFLVSGIIVIEAVFGIPGLGELAVRSVNDQDPMLLLGITLVIALLTFTLLALFDLFVALLDPRIRS